MRVEPVYVCMNFVKFQLRRNGMIISKSSSGDHDSEHAVECDGMECDGMEWKRVVSVNYRYVTGKTSLLSYNYRFHY